MKRAYEITLEHGDNVYGRDYIVVASNDEEAVRKAKKKAASEGGPKNGWRCVKLTERGTELLG